ncbi:MAG: group II intron reverse transcriptase/maturase [Betaproteobacteria bacterium]|nr:group II intron reverse transcriptase/maturase [Betaproteobacteria bacterium]
MMHETGKSDPAIVAVKSANEAGQTAKELMEPRAGAKGNVLQQSTHQTQSWVSVTQALERIRQIARQRKKEKFTALMHHISLELLEAEFFALKGNAAAGVDGLTGSDYEKELEANLRALHSRVHLGSYRPLPSRRVYIPKPDGRQRPIAVAGLEDKIVQRVTATILNAIYEEEFLGFSYGFRPGRSAHDAMDALVVGMESRKVNFVVDADIRSFFDTVDQKWLIRFVEHRIGDKRIIGLIQKWLKAGVLEEGQVRVSQIGTAQGAVISPLLANIYLHYVLDLWAQRWRRRDATGEMIIVRYADDFIVGFENEDDAHRFLDMMRDRLQEFGLSLHPEKTRLIEFGRFAAQNRKRRGLGKPETFDFLGMTFICSKTRRGKYQVKRKSRRDRLRAKLKEIKQTLRRNMHRSIPEQGRWLGRVVTGYFNYHAVPTNMSSLSTFLYHVTDLWKKTLRRRSQKDQTIWTRIRKLASEFLPKPRILHPWPNQRFAVTHPRWEPYALIGHVRFCAGAPSNGRPYRDSQ